jgi:hypothetical protein
MKIVLRYNIKKKELDMFAYAEPGPVPPIIDPPEPDEPKDGGIVKETPVPVNKPEPKEGNFNKPC